MGDIGRLRTYWQDSLPPRGNMADRSPESVSMVLRNARILQGYSLGEVARNINIREGHLEAIEERRFHDLPPLVYARGFVAAYAGFLGQDRNEIVVRFCNEVEHAVPQPELPPVRLDLRPTVEDVSERRMPSMALILAAFVLVGIAYGLWQTATPDNRQVAMEIPPLPDRFQNSAVSALPAAAPSVQMASAPIAIAPLSYSAPPSPLMAEETPAAVGHIVSLRASEESWVQIRTQDGRRVASLVLHAGDVYTVPKDSAGLVLTTGSPRALGVTVDGQTVTLASRPGRSQYLVSLDPARLLNGTALLD